MTRATLPERRNNAADVMVRNVLSYPRRGWLSRQDKRRLKAALAYLRGERDAELEAPSR